MAIYADGGIVGTKPYACSANYINKMSDFCKNCKYNNKKRTGPDACPFNYLYWNFLMQHDFAKNPRMFAAYAGLSKLSEEEKAQIKEEAKNFLAKIFSRS
jgi:deoxyribodipyrimidine photolyase-related protein